MSTKSIKKSLIKECVILLVFFICVSSSYAQTGSIEGVVKDKKTGELLTGATVVINGTTKGSITDFDGHYLIEKIASGKYAIKVSFISYNSMLFDNITVEDGKITTLNLDMEEATLNLEGVTVIATRRQNTEVSMLSSIKSSSLVASGISNQQIARSQLRDASEVVKLIPGITIFDNRFVVVRGLPQRYNSVWLNNAATPSSEADVKSFSFDNIPSSVIGDLIVYKSPAPELPADFSGGFVKINTKNMPEENSFTIGASVSYAQGTTFKNFDTHQGGKLDWLGFDDGGRAIPSEMPDHLNTYDLAQNPILRDKITEIGRSLKNNWNTSTQKANPDLRFSLGLNRKFKLGHKTVGTITSVNYSNTYDSNELSNNSFSIYDYKNDKPSFIDEINDKQYTHTAKVGIMHNWAFELGKGQKLEFRNLFNQIGWSRTSLRDGRDWYNDGRYYRSSELRFLSRSTYSGQIAGEHLFKEGATKIDWNLGYAYSNKKEPDLKRYRQLRSNTDTTKYYMIFADPSNPDLASESRFWIDLHENIISGSLNFTRKMTISNFKPELKMGVYYEDKTRAFSARNFGYARAGNLSTMGQTFLPVQEVFDAENINLTTGIKLSEITSKSDSYSAANNQLAGYASINLPLTSKITIYTGLRVEKNKQSLSSYKQGTTTNVDVNRDIINFFPSLNLTCNFNSKNLVRLAYGQSINRPEFREIAPFYFVDFDQNAGTFGNPNIKQAIISNIEARYELYPSQGETFAIGAFYKKFENPIEMVIIGNNPMQFSFENVASATSYGIEADIRKSLSFISALKNFSLVANASLIRSMVKFEPNKLQRNRPLEGQSPYIVNAGVYYQNENGLMVSALYNVIGERIIAVGRPSPNKWEDIPDIYECPRNVIDLSISKKFGKYIEFKVGIKDLLNQDIQYKQTINTDVDMSIYDPINIGITKHFKRDQITKAYNPGRYITIGITAKI